VRIGATSCEQHALWLVPPATFSRRLNEVAATGCGWPAALRAEASFHFIHAEDIARVCLNLTLAAHQPPGSRGKRAAAGAWCSASRRSAWTDTVSRLCRWRGMSPPPFGLQHQSAG